MSSSVAGITPKYSLFDKIEGCEQNDKFCDKIPRKTHREAVASLTHATTRRNKFYDDISHIINSHSLRKEALTEELFEKSTEINKRLEEKSAAKKTLDSAIKSSQLARKIFIGLASLGGACLLAGAALFSGLLPGLNFIATPLLAHGSAALGAFAVVSIVTGLAGIIATSSKVSSLQTKRSGDVELDSCENISYELAQKQYKKEIAQTEFDKNNALTTVVNEYINDVLDHPVLYNNAALQRDLKEYGKFCTSLNLAGSQPELIAPLTTPPAIVKAGDFGNAVKPLFKEVASPRDLLANNMPRLLALMPNLERLYAPSIALNNDAVAMLPRSLKSLNVRSLYIGEYLSLLENAPALKEIKVEKLGLNNNKIHLTNNLSDLTMEVFDANLVKQIKQHLDRSNRDEFRLREIKINAPTPFNALDVAALPPTLQSLKVSTLSEEGLKELAKQRLVATVLDPKNTHMWLSKNGFGVKEDTSPRAKFDFAFLKSLALKDQDLTDPKMVEALPRQLEKLQIRDIAPALLPQLLAHCPKLKELHITHSDYIAVHRKEFDSPGLLSAIDDAAKKHSDLTIISYKNGRQEIDSRGSQDTPQLFKYA